MLCKKRLEKRSHTREMRIFSEGAKQFRTPLLFLCQFNADTIKPMLFDRDTPKEVETLKLQIEIFVLQTNK